MSFTSAQLATELTTDPKSLGYSQWITANSVGADNNICTLINALTGNGAATIQMTTMTSAQLAAILLPLLSAATGLTALRYAYYQLVFNMVMSQQGPITLSGLATLSTQMIADSIMTTPQATALGQRTGSRAEVLWGQGTVVQTADVELALGQSFK